MITEKSFHEKKKHVALWGCMCTLFLLVNCNCEEIPDKPLSEKFDENGIVVEKVPIWETDVTGKGFISVNVIPVFHKNIVVVPSEPTENEEMLMALDVETGEEIWSWNDYVEGYDFEEVLSREQLNRKDNIVIYNSNNRYCAINLDDGTTLWKEKRNGSGTSAIQVFENHYYTPYELIQADTLIPILVKGDIYSKRWEKIVEVPIDKIQLFGGFFGVHTATGIYTENNELHAFLAFSENVDLFKGQVFNSYISYNLTREIVDFEKKRIPDTVTHSVSGDPVIIGDMMIINGNETIYGINKYTGEIAWERGDFASGVGDGIFISAGYKDRYFAVNTLGNTRRTLELDPFTGATKWIDVGNGGSTNPALHFLNDVLYFISRGDEFLYAYDINGGKLLWKLKSPDNHEGFMTMQVHKAESAEDEDMLVACSWKNAYRFEPAR